MIEGESGAQVWLDGQGDMDNYPELESLSNPSALLIWAFLSIPHIVLVGLLVFAVVVLALGTSLAVFDVTRHFMQWCVRSEKEPAGALTDTRLAPAHKHDSTPPLLSPRDSHQLRIYARRVPTSTTPPQLNTPKASDRVGNIRSSVFDILAKPTPDEIHAYSRPDSDLSTPRSSSPRSRPMSPPPATLTSHPCTD